MYKKASQVLEIPEKPYSRALLVQPFPHQLLTGYEVGEHAGFQSAAQGFGAGVGGADADDVGAAP